MGLLIKLVFSYLIIVIPLCAVSLLLLRNNFSILYNENKRIAENAVESAMSSIELLFYTIDSHTMPYIYSESVRTLLLADGGEQDSQAVNAELTDNSQNWKLLGNLDVNISIMNKNRQLVATSNPSWLLNYRSISAQWMDKIVSANRNKLTVISGYFIFDASTSSLSKVIGLARPIFDQKGEWLGVLLSEIDVTQLENLLNHIPLGSSGYATLVDAKGVVLFHTNDERIGRYTEFTVDDSTGEFSLQDRTNRSIIFTHRKMANYDLTALVILPLDEIMGGLYMMVKYYIAAAILLVVLTFLSPLLTTHSITRPILALRKQMRQIESGVFPPSSSSTRTDEIGDLERGFAHMSELLQALIESEYKAKLRIKEAQYKELVMRINPHFLYNTLEAISMTAYLNHDEQVVKLLHSLAGLMRYSISCNTTLVSFKEEVDYLRNYLLLQQLRNDELFRIVWDISPDVLPIPTIRLILQPLAENCVRHGFCQMKSGGIIYVSALRKDNLLQIAIEDNGKGMPPEQLDRINLRLGAGDETEESSTKIGMLNVNSRIRFYYGSAYGVRAENSPNGGLIVRVVIPVVPREEEKCSAS